MALFPFTSSCNDDNSNKKYKEEKKMQKKQKLFFTIEHIICDITQQIVIEMYIHVERSTIAYHIKPFTVLKCMLPFFCFAVQ